MKPVGFWRQSIDDATELPHPQDLVDPSWPLLERVRVATYLRRGQTACAYLGYSFCRLDCGLPVQFMGTRDLTDGEWVWPEGFAHYVEHHAVKPPTEFLDAIADRLPRLSPVWRIGARARAFVLARRIEEARREAEAEALLPPHTTELHEAARAGDVDRVLRALEAIAVDQPNRLGETALFVASRAGAVDAVALLLARGADVDAKTSSDVTPLSEAASAAVARLLLDAGAAIEPEPVAYAAPLANACMRDDVAFVELLLARGASPNRGDRFRTPLESTRSVRVAEVLLAAGANPKVGSPIASVAGYGDVALVELLLAHGADPNACGAREQSPLFYAATSKTGDVVVPILLAANADPSKPNDLGDTPLHMACARTSIITVKRLLEAGASVRTKSKRGMTPLHWAALAPERRDDAAEVIRILLAAGAEGLDTRDEWGRTPLAIAHERRDEAAARALSCEGARDARPP